MDHKLTHFDLSAQRFGAPQRSGPMLVLPLFGPDRGERFAPPLSGLKLAGVRGYGNVQLTNPTPGGVAIVPLHVGYIQDGAQNHALCRSCFLAAGQTVVVDDACCVQQAQGGYLESREQWFFILPLALREEALGLRGQKNFGKLWPAISRLNQRFGQESRGHLEQILCRRRAFLTQYQSRFELELGQTGALFFLGERLVGLEIAPTAAYFREVWMPLVDFCYGTAALERENPTQPAATATPEPFAATTLPELREQLEASRGLVRKQVGDALACHASEKFSKHEEERYLDLKLFTVSSTNFCGQVVEEDGEIVYASVTAREKALVSGVA